MKIRTLCIHAIHHVPACTNLPCPKHRRGASAKTFRRRPSEREKKDGVAPEDAVYTILTGEVIEEYPERQRVLVFAMLPHKIPLHVVCDCSQSNVLLIVTVYVPDDREWIAFRVRRRGKRK
jgi:hypothetical protein